MNAERIVSLLPSATEWVCALGFEDRLVGVSHECDYPSIAGGLPKVTRSRIDSQLPSGEIDEAVRQHSDQKLSLYDLDTEAIAELQPDLILTQTLCNVCAVSETDVMSSVKSLDACHVLNLVGQTFEQVFDDAAAILEAVGAEPAGVDALVDLRVRAENVRRSCIDEVRPRVTLLEWLNPLFSSGHWTPQLIDWAGGCDPIGIAGTPSREITFAELQSADADILLVAACGLSEDRTRSEFADIQSDYPWENLRCRKAHQIHFFDGSAFFNRPGPRLVDALETVAQVIADWDRQ